MSWLCCVQGDASSASYFLAGGAITGGPVTVHGCGAASIQGDIRFADVLEQMGATMEWTDDTITVSRDPSQRLKGVDVDCGDIPDAAMTLAVRKPKPSPPQTLNLLSSLGWLENTPTHTQSGCRAVCGRADHDTKRAKLASQGNGAHEGDYNRAAQIGGKPKVKQAMCVRVVVFFQLLLVGPPQFILFPSALVRQRSKKARIFAWCILRSTSTPAWRLTHTTTTAWPCALR
jgi:hypothetical protein